MAPFNRFGASKYRNAVPHIPGKEEWYRTNLPPTSSSTALALSTFSSEVKTNRQHIVTVTPSGEVSWRSYDGASGAVGTVKVGSGTVGDWDLSRLEGGLIAVGGTNGSVQIHALPSRSTASLKHVHTINGSSPVTNVSFHPTTPDLLLVSTVAAPATIYNISTTSTEVAITLAAKEPKGIWSSAWSPGGKQVAAIGRSGTLYTWDPRTSTEPTTTRTIPIQPIKPARVVWVDQDIFVTSFSRTRNREYHLFSGSTLTTIFTHSLDTSNGLLIPVVDNERKIVYLSARGDMSLRQVELTGPQGYQETVHPLPAQLASSSLALAHPATLPVMSAQIATLIVSQVDKDGDALLPLGIRVPRRQLIDYHEDLYPEVSATEQRAEDWLQGGDKAPLPISLDPARRGVWEKQLEDAAASTGPSARPADKPGSSTSEEKRPVEAPSKEADPSPSSATRPVSPPLTNSAAPQVQATPVISQATAAPERNGVQAAKKEVTGSRPSLQDGETYISTDYKGRLMGDHIAKQLEDHRSAGKKGPLMVGLQGPQGCGKTTLCNALLTYLQQPPRNLKIAVLSLDDLYKTNKGLKDIAAQHPDNKLLAGRGPPGTHDPQLATEVLFAVQAINDNTSTVHLPIFDKSLCGGEGDRSSETVAVHGPLDVFILEGWSMGFASLPEDNLRQRYESKTTLSDTSYFLDHPLSSLVTLNSYLHDFAAQVYPPFETIVQIEPESYNYVFAWRLEQERNMKKANGGKGMTDEQVQKFVERYMPGYELWKEGVWGAERPWSGRGLRMWYGKDREVVKVDVPDGEGTKTAPKRDVKDEGKSAETGIAPVAPPNEAPSTTNTAAAKTSTESKATTPAAPASSATPTAVAPPAPKAAVPISTKEASTSSTQPFNPGWSRKFLAGKSPLFPSYDQIPAVSTLHQDSLILVVTPYHVFFPIQGPGGRIAVHPLSKKGRMDSGKEAYLSGGVEVADFTVEPFTDGDTVRVALAGEDGIVRVWSISQKEVEGYGEPQHVLKGQGVDKIAQVAFHPTAKDLVVVATNDFGSANIRLFDLATSTESLTTGLDSNGVFNIAFAADGSRLAAATKDGKIVVIDPRDKSSRRSGKAHDSPRSFQIVWIDETHLLSVGFSKGSQRRINLYRIPSDTAADIETVHSLLIDVSPSVLFPVYDPDTSILHVWGKGERQIQAYEVHPDHATEPIAKLPSYTAGTPQLGLAFFGKRLADVKKVEVAKALRLTAKTIEEVTFTIPRNKPEFFQDDIYRETLDSQTPATTADKWLKGDDTPLNRISLRPDDMTPLSQAPQTNSKAKAKFVPARDVLSEAEKKKREMDALFQKAKMEESSDEDDEPKRSGLDPPDDDW